MAGSVESPDRGNGSMLPAMPGQKRKRSLEQNSPDSRRFKRDAPSAMVSGESVQGSFLDSDMASAAAAANVNVADFNALQAAANEEQNETTDPTNASSTAAAALDYPNIHLPHSSEESFAGQASVEEQHDGTSFTTSELAHAPDSLLNNSTPSEPPTSASVPSSVPIVASTPIPQPIANMPAQLPQQTTSASQPPQVHAQQPPVAHSSQNGYGRTAQQGGSRPAVGSEEWHKIRKDNHKEVERRRRETINEGINELSKIVPGCEKNKGSILQRAVAFITQLKENEAQNIEKWTLEKLLTEQAIAELSASNDKLKQECDSLYEDLSKWKRHCANHGIGSPREESTSSTPVGCGTSKASIGGSNSTSACTDISAPKASDDVNTAGITVSTAPTVSPANS